MALDLEESLRVFLASAPQTRHLIQTVELTHSDLSQAWRFWREPYIGEVTTEGDEEVEMIPVGMAIELAGTEGNLDQVFKIGIDTTDADDILRGELNAIPLDTNEKVRCVYREYLSDDLTQPVAVGVLQVESITFVRGTATLSAVSPRLNVTRTGLTYTPRDIPMLRGFI